MRYVRQKKMLLLGFILLFSAFCGCDTIEDNIAYLQGMMQEPLDVKDPPTVPDEQPVAEMPSEEMNLPTMSDLLKEISASGQSDGEQNAGQAEAVTATLYTVNLFFKNRDADDLAVESRTIDKVEGIARRTVEELIRGPVSGNCIALFPADTELTDINITADGVCILDFSPEFQQAAAQERELLYASILHTLEQFDSVRAIELRVAGQTVDTIR